MKIYNIKDVNKFQKTLDSCEGKISLISENGDKYDLRSKLSQLVALQSCFGTSGIENMEIIAENPKDVVRLMHYLMSA